MYFIIITCVQPWARLSFLSCRRPKSANRAVVNFAVCVRHNFSKKSKLFVYEEPNEERPLCKTVVPSLSLKVSFSAPSL